MPTTSKKKFQEKLKIEIRHRDSLLVSSKRTVSNFTEKGLVYQEL